MKQRDKRAMRLAHNRERWADAWAPIKEDNEPDPEGDQYWLDAIAEANSRSEEVNRRDER